MPPDPRRAACTWLSLVVASLALACATSPPQEQPPPVARTDPELARLVVVRDGRSGSLLSFDALLDAAASADVVFLGESHTDETTHRVELAVYEGLVARRGGQVVLALEMFERDAQPALDDYLAGRIDEATFLAASRPWRNYATSYRPLVEAARRAGAPVVASNVPRPLRQRIDSEGDATLAGLAPDERALAPAELLPNTPLYWKRADNAIRGHRAMMPPAAAPGAADAAASPASPEEDAHSAARLTSSQSLWDNTMGESCAQALERHPGYAVCHVNGGFHSQYWDGTVRQLRLRAPDARVATIAIEPVASPQSAEVSGAPEADFVVFAERRADDPQDGEGTVWVQQGLKYRLHLPAAATDGARVPLLIWLPDDGTTAEENLSLWRMRLGDEAAVAVLEAPNVETQEDLAPGGRWFGAESFDDDIAAATAGVDRLWSYLVDHAPVDPARVCVAGEGAGATVATAVALYADRVAARAVAIAPRRYAKLRDLPLPLPELRGDDPRPATSLRVVVEEAETGGAAGDDATWWRDELKEYAAIEFPAEQVFATTDVWQQRVQSVNEVRRALYLPSLPATVVPEQSGDSASRYYLLVRGPSARERLWCQLSAERLHLPVVETPPADPTMHQLEIGIDPDEPGVLPVCPGPFGGTTLVVLPAGTSAADVAAWKALVSNDPLAKQSPFTRSRVAVLDGDPADSLPAVLGKLESERRRNVLIAPAVFYADGETMRALRDLAAGFEGRMTLHWRPGLGGR